MSDYDYNIATALVGIERQLIILTLDPDFRDEQRKLYSYVDRLIELDNSINRYQQIIESIEDDEKLDEKLKQRLLDLKLAYGELVLKTESLLKNWKICLVMPDNIRSVKELAHHSPHMLKGQRIS